LKLSDRRIRLGGAWLFVLPFLWFAHPTLQTLAAGGAIALLGALIRGWAAGHIRKDAVLTVAGPYAHVRNPLYVGSFLLGLGMMIAGGTLAFVLVFLIFYLLVYSRTAVAEADFLLGKFGEGYREYAAAVPLFLPRLRPWRPAGAPAAAFSFERYRGNREWEAGLGMLAGLLVLVAKMVWLG
jgi:protein-S-isoprenylcysteine O-methyltransferase Ste14